MSNPNVRIIEELQSFLNEVAFNPELTNYYRRSKTDFTRKRKLCFKNLTLSIVRLCKKTLSVEMDDFFAEIKATGSCSAAAFSLQRAKLNPLFFYTWSFYLWKSFYRHYDKEVKRWRGYKIVGCDGSSIALIDKPELREHFGGQSNQSSSYTVARTFYCFDVLNKMVLFSRITPYRKGELSTAYEIIQNSAIDSDMLLIFDRNFSNYKMAALMQWKEKEIKYVIRVKDSLNMAKDFVKSKRRSSVTTIYPGPQAIEGLRESGYIITKNTPLKVRLVLVNLPNGVVEILMTNLWEDEGYKCEDFKSLYFLRWGVESNIDFQKNILQLESQSGLTTTSVIQDFYATVFVSNIHFLLIKDAQRHLDAHVSGLKYPRQINNNKAYAKIKKHIVELFISREPIDILQILTNHFIRAPLPVRKNRSFPRIRKNPMTKSKFKTFTNYKPAF